MGVMSEMHQQAAQQQQAPPAQEEQQAPQQQAAPPGMPVENVSSDMAMANPEEPLHMAAKGQYQADLDGQEEEPNVTNDEQAEYERVAEGMGDILYRDEKMSAAVEQSINADDKMGSTIQTGISLMKALDDRMDIDGIVVGQITQDLAGALMELGEAKGIQYTPRESQQILAGIWQGSMFLFAGESDAMAQDYATVTEGMGQEEIDEGNASYEALLAEGTGMGEQLSG